MFIDPKFLDMAIEDTAPESAAPKNTIVCLQNGSIDYRFYDRRARKGRAAEFRAAAIAVRNVGAGAYAFVQKGIARLLTA